MKFYTNFFYSLSITIISLSIIFTGCKDKCEVMTAMQCDDNDFKTQDSFDEENCNCVNELVSGVNGSWLFSVDDFDEENVQEAMILMNDGDTIHFGAGTYKISKTLSVDGKNDIVIIGAGIGVTILDFSDQTAGAEGLKFTSNKNSMVANLTVANPIGDGIKAKDCEGFSFINVATIWDDEGNVENGAYGIYPTTCKHVLVDGCYAKGASDAGLYIGQCEYVIMRNSVADNNVAGIEIENTRYADVYNCSAINNTGGILVFDLPGLPAGQGHTTRVFNNTIKNNNYQNFAPKGNTVADVPPGTGIMLLAASNVEVFSNTLEGNNLMSIGIVDYEVLANFSGATWDDEAYISYPRNIYVHNNTISREERCPETPNTIGGVLQTFFPNNCADVPEIIWDGITSLDNLKDENSICVQNSGSVIDLDLAGWPTDQKIERDIQYFDCTKESLPEVVVNAPTLE